MYGTRTAWFKERAANLATALTYNNYDIGDARWVIFTVTDDDNANVVVNGFTGGKSGDVLVITNNSTLTAPIRIYSELHASASNALAANRVIIPSASTYNDLPKGCSVTMIYSGILNRWVWVHKTGGGSQY